MITALVVLLVAITVAILGSLPWLVVNYFLCVPEPSLGCTRPNDFVMVAQHVLLSNLILLALGGVAIAYLRRLHQRRRRLQRLLAIRSRSRSSV